MPVLWSGSRGPSETLRDLSVVGLTVLLTSASASIFLFPSWTPRFAVLLATGGVGALSLIRQTTARDPLAIGAVAFVGVATASALLSAGPRSSLAGSVGRDLSVLVVVLSFGVWALGRSLPGQRAALVERSFAASVVVVALIGIAQVAFQIDTGYLALQNGRPMSLLINPVYFGAVCAAATALVAHMSTTTTVPWYRVAAFLTAAGCVVSGSRVSWGAMAVPVAALLIGERSRARIVAVLVVVAGAGAGFLLDQIASGGTGAVDRVAGGSAGGRFTVWWYGLEAWLERPFFGHGIGRFRPAVQGRFDSEFVRAAALDEASQPWFDAHNLFVGVLVATGLVGLAVLAVWIVQVARIARGPCAWAALVIAITWLFQPVSIHTLPIAMLLLGISLPVPPIEVPQPVANQRWTAGVVIVLPVLVASFFVVADLRLKSATERPSLGQAESIARWYPGDPIVAGVVAQVARFEFGPGSDSVEWRERAAAREPDRPYWWNLLAEEQLAVGDVDAAAASIETALELQPWNHRSNVLAVEVAVRRGDEAGLTTYLGRLCELDDRACELDAKTVLGAG